MIKKKQHSQLNQQDIHFFPQQQRISMKPDHSVSSSPRTQSTYFVDFVKLTLIFQNFQKLTSFKGCLQKENGIYKVLSI